MQAAPEGRQQAPDPPSFTLQFPVQHSRLNLHVAGSVRQQKPAWQFAEKSQQSAESEQRAPATEHSHWPASQAPLQQSLLELHWSNSVMQHAPNAQVNGEQHRSLGKLHDPPAGLQQEPFAQVPLQHSPASRHEVRFEG